MTTLKEMKVPKNSNGYIPVKFRIVIFGDALRLVQAEQGGLKWYDLTMYIDRGWLPKFPVPILTIKDGKVRTTGILQRGKLGETDKEWFQQQMAKAVTTFQESELIEELTAHQDDEAYNDINAAKDSFLETMDAIKAKRQGQRVNAHIDAALGGGAADDDFDFDDEFGERGNTVPDLLVAATLHLTVSPPLATGCGTYAAVARVLTRPLSLLTPDHLLRWRGAEDQHSQVQHDADQLCHVSADPVLPRVLVAARG